MSDRLLSGLCRCFLTAFLVSVLLTTAHAAPIAYQTGLSGANENPANASPGAGFATVVVDLGANTLMVDVTFADLLGDTTAAHIHCCLAPPTNATVATELPSFTGFPLGVTSGSYNHTFDLSDVSFYNPTFLNANGGTAAGAEAALAAGLAQGEAYLNIHSTFRPGGEIRGYLQQVPEPATLALLGLALAGLRLAQRRRA